MPTRSSAGGPVDAMVTDVHLRNAVAGLRALGRGGHRVLALASSWAAPGLWSRYAAARAVAPDLLDDPPGFAAAVGDLARSRGPLVVYPGWENAVDVLFGASPPLPPEAILPYPSQEVLMRVRDKRRLPSLAEGSGLRAPRTLVEGTAGELERASLPARCLLKAPAAGGVMVRAYVCQSVQELRGHLRALPDEQPVLVQEHLEGPLMSLALVITRHGSVSARFQQVAHRTFPADAGPSSIAVSVAPDEDLVERAAAMLAGIGFWGFAQLQFVDDANGPVLIDVNVRFYGSLPLALACGVDLPGAWHAAALDRPTPAPRPYRVGVTYRWLEAEISAALQRQRAAGDVLRRAPAPRVGAMWAAADPLPSALLAARTVTDRVQRRVTGPASTWLRDRRLAPATPEPRP